MTTEIHSKSKRPLWFGVGAFLSAIGASVCCIGPLVLLSLGIGGAWLSTLTSMEAIRPFFLIATLVFLVLAFRKLYLVPDNCKAEEDCTSVSVKRNQRIIFWMGSLFLLGLLAFPWYGPLFLE